MLDHLCWASLVLYPLLEPTGCPGWWFLNSPVLFTARQHFCQVIGKAWSRSNPCREWHGFAFPMYSNDSHAHHFSLLKNWPSHRMAKVFDLQTKIWKFSRQMQFTSQRSLSAMQATQTKNKQWLAGPAKVKILPKNGKSTRPTRGKTQLFIGCCIGGQSFHFLLEDGSQYRKCHPWSSPAWSVMLLKMSRHVSFTVNVCQSMPDVA